MGKQHRDFVIYVNNGVAINALVAVSRGVFFPATQTEPAKTIEHLTLVYLDPAAQANIMTGDQLRNSIKTVFDVAPLGDGVVTGWKDVVAEVVAPSDIAQGSGSGSERWPDESGGWPTMGADVEGYPVPKGHPSDVTTPPVSSPNAPPLSNALPTESEAIAEAQVADAEVLDDKIMSGPDGLTDAQRGYKWGSEAHKMAIAGLPEIAAEVPAEDIIQPDPEVVAATQPTAEDLDAHVADHTPHD